MKGKDYGIQTRSFLKTLNSILQLWYQLLYIILYKMQPFLLKELRYKKNSNK